MKLRWGILSAGKISQDFCAALQVLPKEDHVITAVAARNVADAKTLADLYGVKNVYSDYDKLATDQDVDIVYIGTINNHHYAMAKMLLEHRKSVLCEKPLCVNVKQTKALIALAREKNVFFMEGLWVRCFPVMEQLQHELTNRTVGDVSQVIVTFGVQIADVPRVKERNLAGGATLDIGIYCAQLASLVFEAEKPLQIVTAGHLNESGTDESSTTALIYTKGRTATLITSTKVDLPNEALIIGNKGTIKIPFRFWCPTALETPDRKFEFPLPETSHTFNFHNSVGLSYEAEHVRQCLINGLTESPLITLDESILIAEILESIRKQVGVHYAEDDEEF